MDSMPPIIVSDTPCKPDKRQVEMVSEAVMQNFKTLVNEEAQIEIANLRKKVRAHEKTIRKVRWKLSSLKLETDQMGQILADGDDDASPNARKVETPKPQGFRNQTSPFDYN